MGNKIIKVLLICFLFCGCGLVQNKPTQYTSDLHNKINMSVQDGVITVTTRMTPKGVQSFCSCDRKFVKRLMEL